MLFPLGTLFGLLGLWLLSGRVRAAAPDARRRAWGVFWAGVALAVVLMWIFIAGRRPQYDGAVGLLASMLGHAPWVAVLVMRARSRPTSPFSGRFEPPVA